MTQNGPKKKNLTQKNALAEVAEMAKTILKMLTAEIATFATFASANFYKPKTVRGKVSQLSQLSHAKIRYDDMRS